MAADDRAAACTCDPKLLPNVTNAQCPQHGILAFFASSEPEPSYDDLVTALRRVYMWVSPAALKEDADTALVEARRICREALGMKPEGDE